MTDSVLTFDGIRVGDVYNLNHPIYSVGHDLLPTLEEFQKDRDKRTVLGNIKHNDEFVVIDLEQDHQDWRGIYVRIMVVGAFSPLVGWISVLRTLPDYRRSWIKTGELVSNG